MLSKEQALIFYVFGLLFVLCGGFLLPATTADVSLSHPQYIVLGFEKEAVRIYVEKRTNEHGFTIGRLILQDRKGDVALAQLSQLEGDVLISSARQALCFVRFRTSLTTWRYWNSEAQMEIVNEAMSSHLPTYGLPLHLLPVKLVGSGFRGVISNKAYKLGGFSHTKCRQIGNHFEITRWIFVESRTFPHVEKIRETVYGDGKYKKQILISEPLPDLPDTNWQIPVLL